MTLPPGPELDRAVAEAIGLVATHRTIDGRTWFVDPRDGTLAVPIEFRPSTDLNHAFQAAEMAGMFLELNRLADSWQAHTYAMNGKSCTAPTPALAICYAILKHTC